jgi:hypothetical protein
MVALVAPAHADPVNDFSSWVNTVRSNNHVAPLNVDATFSSVAQQWANHLAATGVLAHNPSLSSQAPTGWTKMGENIGDGYTLAATFDALVNSPDHFANMVDPTYNRTGVGVATDSEGQVWVVQDFGDYPPPTPAAMTFPTAGSMIFGTPQTFTWQQAPGGQYYCVTVGSKQGGVDLVNSGLLQANQLGYSVPALPGGQPLWARIYTYNQGTWVYSDVSFSVSGPSTATFTQPTNGATNMDTTKPLTWAPGPSAVYYVATVGSTQGGYDLVNSGLLTSAQTSYPVPALPAGRTLWARIYSYIGGTWRISDVAFTAAARH